MNCGSVLKTSQNGEDSNAVKTCTKCKKNKQSQSAFGQPHHFTVYSDLHDSARVSDREQILEHMEERAALPRSHFIGIGDLGDWIVPSDTKRYMPSVNKPKLATVDDFIDAHLDDQIDTYKKFPWRFIGTGNHCHEILKRHHTNPMARLARSLNVPFAGYAGYAKFRFHNGTGISAACTFTILYHHGAWGGRVVKGFGGARDYARHFEGWDVFAYGHNHQCNVHHEAKIDFTAKGKINKRSVYFVNTGTFYDGVGCEGQTTYAEVKGYGPVAMAAPLIIVTPNKQVDKNVKITVTAG